MEYHEGSGHQQHVGCKKRKRQNWTNLETSVLVECKDKHGENECRFYNGTPAVTDWEAIGREIADRLGSKSIAKSGEQCRYRWETLVKAYKKVRNHCKYVGKEFSELTRTEKVELKLATTLKDEWYEVIEQGYGTDFRCAKSKSGQVDNALPTLVYNPGSASSCNQRFDIFAIQHESRSLDPGQPLIEAEMPPLRLTHGCNANEIGDLNHVGSYVPTQFESGSTLVRNSETLEKEDALVDLILGYNTHGIGDLNHVGLHAPTQFESGSTCVGSSETLEKEDGFVNFMLGCNTHEFGDVNHVDLNVPTQFESSSTRVQNSETLEMEDALVHLMLGSNTHEIGDLNHVGLHAPTQFESSSTRVQNSETLEKEDATVHLIHGYHTHEIGDLNHVGLHTPTQFESGSTLVRNSETLEKEDDATPVTPECTTMNDALNPRAPEFPIPSERLNQKSRLEIVTISGFNLMGRDLKSTLLNLIYRVLCQNDHDMHDDGTCEMEALCRWLANVQGVRLLEARVQVLELVRRDVVTICLSSYDSRIWLDLSTLRKFKQYLEKVARTHFSRVYDDNVSILDSSLLMDRLTVVALVGCQVLKKVDLGNLPRLRSLVISECDDLEEVCGWEDLRELGWLDVSHCSSYRDCPKFECLPSLKEAHFGFVGWTDETGFELDFSQCVQLRRLEMWDVWGIKESIDLSTLKCLEELSFNHCDALESIVGLSGLHSLSLLNFGGCEALKRLPDLGYVTSLVELDLSGSGVEEICGVVNLLSLTRLLLHGCEHLKRLPYLGHLTALAHLDIRETGVDEIPGVRELVNLKTLNCFDSKLEWLPDLRHLPRLEWVNVRKTPLSQVPSSIYFGNVEVRFNKDLDMEDDVSSSQ